MANREGPLYYPIQGGFFIVKPSPFIFDRMLEVYTESPYRIGSAWNNTKIGHYWGGMTIQGFLPFFYYRAQNNINSIQPKLSYKAVNSCVYDLMLDRFCP